MPITQVIKHAYLVLHDDCQGRPDALGGVFYTRVAVASRQVILVSCVLTAVLTVRPRWLRFWGDFPPRRHVGVDPHLLEYEVGPWFADALIHMPNLDTVSFGHGHVHPSFYVGVPWVILAAVLSTPQVRNVHFPGPILQHSDITLPKSINLSVAPITSFRCIPPDDYRDSHRFCIPDTMLAAVIARQAHASLETLVLPSEIAPYRAFWRQDWPCLRELTLRGRRFDIGDLGVPMALMPVLARMPKLHVLNLELSQPLGIERQLMCPADWNAGCPWPNLETLLISYPHPNDQIYTLLPSTLRTLALRCWPRHYLHQLPSSQMAMDKGTWYSPILTSSEMLSILRRCDTSGSLRNVEHADLEFQEDDRYIELYRLISSVFPNVTSLTIHRYRQHGTDDSSVVRDS